MTAVEVSPGPSVSHSGHKGGLAGEDLTEIAHSSSSTLSGMRFTHLDDSGTHLRNASPNFFLTTEDLCLGVSNQLQPCGRRLSEDRLAICILPKEVVTGADILPTLLREDSIFLLPERSPS